MKWETGRAASGAEGRTALNGVKGPSVEEGRWTVWGRRLIFDLPGDSPWPSAVGQSAAPHGGGQLERAPGWDFGSSDSLRASEGVGMKG